MNIDNQTKKNIAIITVSVISILGYVYLTSQQNVDVIVIPPINRIGNNISINVLVNPNGINISGLQSNVKFNQSIINIISIEQGDIFTNHSTYFSNGSKDNLSSINNTNGTVSYIMTVILGNSSGDNNPGTFFKLNSKIISEGIINISLWYVLISDPNAMPVNYIIYNNTINTSNLHRLQQYGNITGTVRLR
jgi:hypothetical protein